jgi:uncharacterized protein with WD repeat
VLDARFSPDGTFVATASDDRTAGIWEGATGRRLVLVRAHQGPVHSVEFSPDGERFVTASDDNTARVWNAHTGEPVSPPLRHARSVIRASFSHDSRWIVTASIDNTARLWDARSGEATSEPMKQPGSLTTVQFSPEGQRVLTACPGWATRLWDARLGQPLSEPLRHRPDMGADSAQWSPDGQRVVTASRDGAARLWDTPRVTQPIPEWLADLAEGLAGVRYNRQRALELVPWEEVARLRERFVGGVVDQTNQCQRIARWLFADRKLRPISPFSRITFPDYLQRRFDEGTVASLREVVSLAPDNAAARHRLDELEAKAKPTP